MKTKIEIQLTIPDEGEGYAHYILGEIGDICTSLGCKVESISASGSGGEISKAFVQSEDVIDVEWTEIK